MEKQHKDNFWTWAMKLKFISFFAVWVYTSLMVIYYMAIILPEKFANSPVITQFTTMAGSVIMVIVGFFFGSMYQKLKQNESGGQLPGTIDMQLTATSKEDPLKKEIDPESKPE